MAATQEFQSLTLSDLFRLYGVDFGIGSNIEVTGWVRTCRDQKKDVFIALSDGSSQNTVQIIVSSDMFADLTPFAKLTTGSSISVKGTLVKSPAKEQDFELFAKYITIYQKCHPDYPLQKAGLPLDFLRQIPHLRQRSNLFRAIASTKSEVYHAIHEFFRARSYIYVDLPVITKNACESGCQPLQVTSLINDNRTGSLPAKMIDGQTSDKIDYSKDFFNTATYLTVSNQLHLESQQHGLGYVYTITPASRGEPSQSSKHLAHFNMLEWEALFKNLDENIDIAEGCIKMVIKHCLTNCKAEMLVFDKFAQKMQLIGDS